ncbi:hypothetical protein [Kocuria rosea]|uniref:hypothetical protein n=1 Tax=Kocuria rosea TaxID=1275 RepID=UPI00203CC753|nr:hypothetical protein [Kocuria rosea]MCM3687302.1 hypothetical protein [Kocuria rosea]
MPNLRLLALLMAGALLFVAGIVMLGSITNAVATGSGGSWVVAAASALALAGLAPGARRLATTTPRPNSRPASSYPGDAGVRLDIASVVAVVLLGSVQLLFIAVVHEGAQYTCTTSPLPPGASDAPAQAQMTVLPPSLVCHYPAPGDPATMISVDRFSAGPWLFFTCLTALVLTLSGGLLLRLRHRWRTEGRTTTRSSPPSTGAAAGEGPSAARSSLPVSRLAPVLALGACLLVVGWLAVWAMTATVRAPSWAMGMISAALLMVVLRVVLTARHLASAPNQLPAAAPLAPPAPLALPAPVSRGWAWPPAVLAAVAVLVWSINQLFYGYRVRDGPGYACATDWPVPTSIISSSMVTADTTAFPPTLICHYAPAPGAAHTITVDHYPTGPEVFYTSLGALTVAAFLGLVLLARFHRRERAQTAVAAARHQ